MNLMNWCHASPQGTPSAIQVLGMTSLGIQEKTRMERTLGKGAIETHAVLIRKNAEKTKVTVTQTLSAMDHLFVNITAVSFPEDSVDTLAAANSLVEPIV